MRADEAQYLHTFDDAEPSDDDYWAPAIEDRAFEKLLIEDDGSSVWPSDEEEISLEAGQGECEPQNPYHSLSSIPTPDLSATPKVSISEFKALQNQVSLLMEVVVSNRVAYESQLSERDAARTILTNKSSPLENNNNTAVSSGGWGIQAHVNFLRSEMSLNRQRMAELEEKFSGDERRDQWYMDVTTSMRKVLSDIGGMRRYVESLSVEQQRLKNVNVANTNSLVNLEIQVQEAVKTSASIPEDPLGKRLEKLESQLNTIESSFELLNGRVQGLESECDRLFTDVLSLTDQFKGHGVDCSRLIEEMQRDVKNLLSVEFDIQNVAQSVEQHNMIMENAAQALKLSLQEQRTLLQQDLFAVIEKFQTQLGAEVAILSQRLENQEFALHMTYETRVTETAKKLESQIRSTVNLESTMLQDLILAKVEETDKNFSDRLERLDYKLNLFHKGEFTGFQAERNPSQLDFQNLFMRLDVCEKGVAQLQKIQMDTIRASKATVHNCESVVPQVEALEAWKVLIEKERKLKLGDHSNSLEEQMQAWLKDHKRKNEIWKNEMQERLYLCLKYIESTNQEWTKQTREVLLNWTNTVQDKLNNWIGTVEGGPGDSSTWKERQSANCNAKCQE